MLRNLVNRRINISFLPPFDTLDSNISYTVEKLESFNSYRRSGNDPDELYKEGYDPVKIAEDEEDGRQLLTLISDHADTHVVPENYIKLLDRSSIVSYANKVIVLNIGSQDVRDDHTLLLQEITKIAKSILGVEAEASLIEVSKRVTKTQAQHDATILTRDAKKDTNYDSSHILTKKLALCQQEKSAMLTCMKPK